MMKQKFNQGDKIFAKVRGYPPWPARVEGVADETPSKLKYHVYFYGTGETGVVKAEEISLFAETKHKYGKPKKHKNFTEALLQIEEELSPAEKELIASQQHLAVNDDSLSDTPDQKALSRKSSSTPLSPKYKREKKRKSEVEPSDESEPKSQRLSGAKEDDVTSRSGRKIKPKRFADFDEVPADDSKTTPKTAPAKQSKTTPELKPKGDFLIAVVNDEEVKIPLRLNRPNYTSNKSMEEWDDLVFKYALSLKNKLQSGETIPEGIEAHMETWTQNKLDTIEKAKDMKQEFLKIETHMLDIDVNIKNSLSLKKADVQKCLDLLDELAELKLTPLMLKKHPEVVETIKKTRKYVGNISNWKMSDTEKQEFQDKSVEIRKKSDLVYNKFKAIFLVPSGKSFWDIFSQDLEAFNRKTEHLSPDQVFSIIKEPE